MYRINRTDAVLATVMASACVTALCSYVVLSAAHDARQGTQHAATELSATAGDGDATATGRHYPTPDTVGVTAALAGFDDPAPRARQAPSLSTFRSHGQVASVTPDITGVDAREVVVIAGQPPVLPRPRPDTGAELVAVARNLSTAQALAFATPTARPDTILALAAPTLDGDAAPIDTPAPSVLLAAVSPRPALRPEGLALRFPATTGPQAGDRVEVARAPALEEELTLARLEDDADDRRLIAPRAGANPCSSRLTREIPRRRNGAQSGSAFMASLGNGSGSGRDNAIVAEAMRGNVPDFLRDLQPVTFTGIAGGRQTEVTICVTPDYLAIGSDGDHVRAPLGLPAALRVADAFDMVLPTTRMVDAIYQQADVRLSPQPMTPGPQMSSTDYFMRHDATVDAQLARAGGRSGVLVAGHKKDVVLANRLARAPGRVAIYGWHRTNGNPIQPLSTVHGEYYADYSHGIRLVSRTAYINGDAVDLRSLLTSGTYASLLNTDGPLNATTVRLAQLQ